MSDLSREEVMDELEHWTETAWQKYTLPDRVELLRMSGHDAEWCALSWSSIPLSVRRDITNAFQTEVLKQ